MGEELKKIIYKILFQFNDVMYIFSRNESEFVSTPFFPLLLGMSIGVGKRVGFQNAVDDENQAYTLKSGN